MNVGHKSGRFGGIDCQNCTNVSPLEFLALNDLERFSVTDRNVVKEINLVSRNNAIASNHPGGSIFALGDGSARFISKTIRRQLYGNGGRLSSLRNLLCLFLAALISFPVSTSSAWGAFRSISGSGLAVLT